MREASPLRWMRWLLLSAAVIALDLATKAWVSGAFQLGESREVLSFFNLVLAHNTGAAFSFLAGAGGWQRWFFTAVTVVISVALLVGLRRHHDDKPLIAAALAPVLGGALGQPFQPPPPGPLRRFLHLFLGRAHLPA